MRALVVDPSAPGHLRLGEAPDPIPGPAQPVIEVAAASLNRGEVPEHSGAAEEVRQLLARKVAGKAVFEIR